MSLTTCLRRAGDALSAADRRRINDGVRQMRAEGLSQDEAARRVVENMLAEADAALRDLGDVRAMREAGAPELLRSAPQDPEIERQRRDTERAYGGRDGYDRAKAAGRTKLTFGQWVTVRAPAFKAWFGDWQAVQTQRRLDDMDPVVVRVPSEWRGLDVDALRARVRDGLDAAVKAATTVEHPEIGSIRVGRAGAGKTVAEGRDPGKLLIAADLRNVLPAAVLSSATPGDGQNINGYAKLAARVDVGGTELVALFTVRVQRDGNWYYNTVAVVDPETQTPAEAGAATAGPVRDATTGEVEGDPLLTAVRGFSRRPLARVNPDTVSKVIDRDTGEPMVVYHGTKGDIRAFDLARAGASTRGGTTGASGIYLTPDAKFASRYAGAGNGANVMPLFVALRNPASRDALRGFGLTSAALSQDDVRMLQERGFDGAEDPALKEIVAFEPTQIKSASGNAGTFDPVDPDIRRSRAQRADEPVAAPDGSLDFGAITPDMAAEMRRQAGPIRLTQGEHRPDGTGYGLAHIEARHGREIRAAGFTDVPAFVSSAVSKIDEVWQPGATSQLIAVSGGRRGRVVFLQLQVTADGAGDFYRVNSAFPVDAGRFTDRKVRKEGWKPLWTRNPVSEQPSGDPGFADVPPNAGGAAPTVSPQSGGRSVPPADAQRSPVQPPPASPAANRGRQPVSRRFTLPRFDRAMRTIEFIQDRHNRWKQAIAAIERQGGLVTEENDFYRTEERMHGQMAALAEDFRKDIQGFAEGLVRDGITQEELAEFAYALHAKERNAALRAKRDANPNTGFDSWSGMTDQEADQILADARASGRYSAMLRHQKTLQSWIQGTRDLMLDEGLITPDEYAALSTMYANYVPLRGLPDDPNADPDQGLIPVPPNATALERASIAARNLLRSDTSLPGRGTGRGFNVRGRETERARGRYSRADQIIENIIADRIGTIQRAGKNRVLRSFAAFVRDNPSANLWEVNAVQRRPLFTTDPDTGDQVIEEVSQVAKGEDTVAVKDGGVEIYIKIRDKALLAQMRAMNVEKLNRFYASLNAANRMLGRLYTSLNPVFTVLNFFRDVTAASFGMVDEAGFKAAGAMLKAIPRGIAESWNAEFRKPSAAYQLYRATGGKTGFMGFRDLDEITRDLQRDLRNAGRSYWNPAKSGIKALELIEGLNGVLENATRFAAFEAARKAGMSTAKAASVSKNITVNFNRKGTQQGLSALFLFFNPAIQGTARIAQSLRSPKVLGALGTAMAGTAMLALQNAAMGEDDDGVAWWDKIPPEIKDRNLIIVLPAVMKEAGEGIPGSKTGRYIKIPLPYGYNWFATIANQAVDVWRHSQDPARGRSMAEASLLIARSAMTAYMPLTEVSTSVETPLALGQAAIPSAVDPLFQPLFNLNAFGRPLYPEEGPGEAGMPTSERYFAGQAGTIFQRAASAINEATGGDRYVPGSIGFVDTSFAPGSIEAIVRGYGGGPVTFTLDLINAVYARQSIQREDLDVRRLPFVKQLYGHIDAESDRVRGYDVIEKVSKVADPMKRAERGADNGDESAQASIDRQIAAAGNLIDLADARDDARKELGDIRKSELQVLADSALDDAAKYRELQALAAEKRTILQNLNQDYADALRREAGLETPETKARRDARLRPLSEQAKRIRDDRALDEPTRERMLADVASQARRVRQEEAPQEPALQVSPEIGRRAVTGVTRFVEGIGR